MQTCDCRNSWIKLKTREGYGYWTKTIVPQLKNGIVKIIFKTKQSSKKTFIKMSVGHSNVCKHSPYYITFKIQMF